MWCAFIPSSMKNSAQPVISWPKSRTSSFFGVTMSFAESRSWALTGRPCMGMSLPAGAGAFFTPVRFRERPSGCFKTSIRAGSMISPS